MTASSAAIPLKPLLKWSGNAGRKKFISPLISPPLRYPCVYGIDMQTRTEFVARNASLDEIARRIGADKVIYQKLESLKKAVQLGNPRLKHFCGACFDGQYPTGDVTPEVLKRIEEEKERLPSSSLSSIFETRPFLFPPVIEKINQGSFQGNLR
jgi:amidophosphoribosyltransferase